jgi:hypothetical protein
VGDGIFSILIHDLGKMEKCKEKIDERFTQIAFFNVAFGPPGNCGIIHQESKD